jgi:GTP 3',8-cyclase
VYLRVSLTDRCNLRCRYCLPEHARFAPDRASASELQRMMALIAAAVPLHKIRLTGGEPTLCEDVVDHVRFARTLVDIVGMTSNGILLEALLPELQAAGLNRLNISLDTVDPERFRAISRRDGLPQVLAAIRRASALGFTPLKIDAVALPETDYGDLLRLALHENLHLRFIELMAIGEALPWQAEAKIESETIRARLFADGFSLTERRDRDEPTARVYAVDGHNVEDCSLGFVTTVTQPFCATCDRLRLSSQGRFYTCLMDDTGHELLEPLRAGDEDEVIRRVRHAVALKAPPERMERHTVMAEIGG